jgi:hypothetical protein
MFVRYPPGKIRYEDDRPVALLGVRVAASRFRLVDLPLGMPTTSARSGRGPWALYRWARRSWSSTPTVPSAGRRPRLRPRSAAWPPVRARASWTGRPPGPSSSC